MAKSKRARMRLWMRLCPGAGSRQVKRQEDRRRDYQKRWWVQLGKAVLTAINDRRNHAAKENISG